MKTSLLATTLCLALGLFVNSISLPACANQEENEKKQSTSERPIDLVICLDTSGSMDGLLDAAKQKIWDIVNELGTARPKPHLRVGLYAYGTPEFGAESGYVRKVLDLTDDLDSAFTELAALRTNGGDEYCARVISTAMNQQSWSSDKNALKIIVDAGNEPATQDPKLDAVKVAQTAISQGIVVNTIYCGQQSSPEANGWRQLARAADGQFAAIDHNNGTVIVSTPFDQKLAELSSNINVTYLAYGKAGRKRQLQQVAADAISYQLSAANSAARAEAKAGSQYRNSDWDLIDARKTEGFEVSHLAKADLPEAMQNMTAEEQNSYLDTKAKERADIQRQIAELSSQREQFIQEELKKSNKSTDKSFDAAMLKALREQAQRKGFTFDNQSE